MAIIQAVDETFAEETEFGIVLVELGAQDSESCEMMAPVLESIDHKHSDRIKIVTIDIEENPELALRYNVKSVPTLLYFNDGELMNQTDGYRSEEEIVFITESFL